ncbi:MAG: hypothetical protein JEZ04_00765 [Spirochaetales bacterium]|nr:hypothetical protein [Spirochaetales bacterium]
MSGEIKNMRLSDQVKDTAMRKYLYLDLDIGELIDRMRNLKLTDIGNDEHAPFNAKVRGYTGAIDEEGNPWLIKEVGLAEAQELRIQEIAYFMDFILNTPAAPAILLNYDGRLYRATKHVINAMQISSYNYMEPPYIKILANDLLNRWLFFDEDRNPNNYLVKHDLDDSPYIVVIDYNKVDLETEGMKIWGLENKFGWHRKEKTRFLTLLKPGNFDNLCLEDFESRLQLFDTIDEKTISGICQAAFVGDILEDAEASCKKITNNLLVRKNYLTEYFRKWFIERDETKEKEIDDRYADLGQSFLDYYKRES